MQAGRDRVLFARINCQDQAEVPGVRERKVQRIISRFAFHQSILSKMEQLDPKYDKMIDAASPDLSFDNLVKKYNLDAPVQAEKK